jgi:hypothetical protein
MWYKSFNQLPSYRDPETKYWWWDLSFTWDEMHAYAEILRAYRKKMNPEIDNSSLPGVIADWTFGIATGREPNMELRPYGSGKNYFRDKDKGTLVLMGRDVRLEASLIGKTKHGIDNRKYHWYGLVLVDLTKKSAAIVGLANEDLLERHGEQKEDHVVYNVPAAELLRGEWQKWALPHRQEELKEWFKTIP